MSRVGSWQHTEWNNIENLKKYYRKCVFLYYINRGVNAMTRNYLLIVTYVSF